MIKICPVCGKAFEDSPRPRGRRIYCSIACRSRAAYKRHLAQRRASARKYYELHREERLAYRKAFYQANCERMREWWREYRKIPEVNARQRAKCREYYRKYPLMAEMRYQAMCEKFSTDAKAYAEWRRKRRQSRELKAIKEGRIYRPCLAQRIPDWATKGQRIMDTASPWLIENLTPEQNAYARNLFIERKERMCK